MTRARAIAAAQTIPVRGDVAANVESHLRLVHVAAFEGARLLVFPELSLTGYELEIADELAFSRHDPRLGPLRDLASRHEMTLVVGAPVRVAARLYIGAFVLYPGGRVGLYTKHHLGAFPQDVNPDGMVPPAEATVFHAGSRNPLVRVAGHNAAVAVCADIGQPTHPKKAAARGAGMYLASAFVIPPDFEQDTAKLRSYAAAYGMAVVFANYGGPSGGLPSAGRSGVWSDSGELLVQLGPRGSGLAVAIETEGGWRGTTVAVDA